MKTIIIKLNIEEVLAGGGHVIIELTGEKSSESSQIKVGTKETGESISEGQEAEKTPKSQLLFGYMEKIIHKLKEIGKQRTSETYRTTLNSFRRYRRGEDIEIGLLNADLVCDYERWLHGQGVCQNSSSFYMRILRAVYNRAVREGKTENRNPFQRVYTGIARTTKRAIGANALRQLENLSIRDIKTRFARDLFMFSFYTQGMAFVDMAHLKRSNINDGYLVYYRQKTGQLISIRWTEQMEQIVKQYEATQTGYLLPIIKSLHHQRSQIRSCQYEVNKLLKSVAEKADLKQNLTMYVARHSWASIAHELNIPIDIISRGMGHSSEKTTRIYLKEIDCGRLAEANQQVMSFLRQQKCN